MSEPKRIRNFAIVAHIDHGKSTLADRLLELTGTIEKRKMMEQVLDSNPIERERGITIKLAPVRMKYYYNNEEYILNLIDTPGHVDFSYEVSRSMAACEGILLVVDATKGVQAQTVAHYNLIKKNMLTVIPIVNKIDMDSANIDIVTRQLTENLNFKKEEIIYISAKTGKNIDAVLKSIVEKIPPPSGREDIFRGFVFSSQYDAHLGVVVYVKINDGEIDLSINNKNMPGYKFYMSGAEFKPIEIGVFTPDKRQKNNLKLGEVGFIATGLKDIHLAQTGDTIIQKNEKSQPLPGFVKPTPFVFLSLYPTNNDDYLLLREGLEKLQLTDSSLSIKPASSPSLGKGFLCGFLGLLHADVTKERLLREFGLNLVATMPTVEYEIKIKNGEILKIRSADDFPDPSLIEEIKEPVMMCEIYAPKEYLGDIMQLSQEKRAQFINLNYFGEQAEISYLIPLSEMIIDFFDKLKSVTKGYASLEYEFYENQRADAVKLDILINQEKAHAFSQIIVKEKANSAANNLVNKLKDLIPRHQFKIAIQAAIGGKIVARSDIGSFRKDVTAKLYGGDRTRKDKLIEAQKKGKKKMRGIGRVEIPQEVFLKVHS